MDFKLKCPKCGSDKIGNAYVANRWGDADKADDQARCENCEYQGYIADSIYGKGFAYEESEVTDNARV